MFTTSHTLSTVVSLYDHKNWSARRKARNYFLVQAVTLAVFTATSVQTILWQFLTEDLNASYTQLNISLAISSAGVSFGCIIFIPFAIKYGRRPVYVVSTFFIVVMSFWTSRMTTVWELYVTNLCMGLAGAANETLVMITVADLFFVHQRGTMNGIYVSMAIIGVKNNYVGISELANFFRHPSLLFLQVFKLMLWVGDGVITASLFSLALFFFSSYSFTKKQNMYLLFKPKLHHLVLRMSLGRRPSHLANALQIAPPQSPVSLQPQRITDLIQISHFITGKNGFHFTRIPLSHFGPWSIDPSPFSSHFRRFCSRQSNTHSCFVGLPV